MLRGLASRMHARGALDHEDLVQAAALALMRSRELYDPEKGSKWSSYAAQRAQGAMIDALRDIDHIPRLARTRLKAAGLPGSRILSLDHQGVDVSREGFFDGVLETDAEARDIWAAVKKRLDERTSRVVEMYFRESRTLLEIGGILGLSETRTCQILARGVGRLRDLWSPTSK